MKYHSLHAIWIILLTIVIIIFENKINSIHAQPVKKIVSWYSQIHSKENPLEIFIQDEDKEVIASTTLNCKDIRHSNAYNSETLGNNASLLAPSYSENEEQKFFESDASLNFLQPETMLEENSLRRDTSVKTLQNNEDTINSQSGFPSIINNTFPTETHDIKKTRRTKKAKKVKRVKTNYQTIDTLNANTTLKYNQSLIVTLSPFHNISSDISLLKKKLLLKPYSNTLNQPSLKPNVNIRDPNILKSLKSMDLSLLSFPPAFMYGNAIVRNERKGPVNSTHEVKKRFVPGQMRSYDIENHVPGESSIKSYNNSYQQVLRPHLNVSKYTGIQLNNLQNAPVIDNLSSKVQLPFSSENDSCNMFESLPIILIKPDGEIVKVDTVDNVAYNVQTQSTGKVDEQIVPNLGEIVNGVTVIPVYIGPGITEGVNTNKLVTEGTNIYQNSSETLEFIPPPHGYMLSNITKENMNMNYEIPLPQDVNRYNVSLDNVTFCNKTEYVQLKINECENIDKNYNISQTETVFKINQLENMNKINDVSKTISNINNSSYWDRFLVNVGGEKFMQSELSQMQTYLNNSDTHLSKDVSNLIYDQDNVENISSNCSTNSSKDLEIINNLMHEILSNKMFTNINVPERYSFKVFTTDINRNCNRKQGVEERVTCRTQCPMVNNRNNCSRNSWGPYYLTTRPSVRPNENECRQTTNSEGHIKILGFILEDGCNKTTVKSTCQETQTLCNPNWKLLDYGKRNYLSTTNYNSSKQHHNIYWTDGYNIPNRSFKRPTTGRSEFTAGQDQFEFTEVTHRAYHFTTSSSYNNIINRFTSSSYDNFIRKQPDMSVNDFVSRNPTSRFNNEDVTEEMNMQEVKQFLKLIKSALDRKMTRQAEKEHPEIEVRSNLAKDNIYYKGMNDLLVY